jgi:hypothetical protein
MYEGNENTNGKFFLNYKYGARFPFWEKKIVTLAIDRLKKKGW